MIPKSAIFYFPALDPSLYMPVIFINALCPAQDLYISFFTIKPLNDSCEQLSVTWLCLTKPDIEVVSNLYLNH